MRTKRSRKKNKTFFHKGPIFGGKEPRHSFRATLNGVREIRVLHRVWQLALEPVEHLRGHSLIRRLQNNLRFCTRVDSLFGGKEQNYKRWNDQQQGDAERAGDSRRIGFEPAKNFLMKGKEKYGEDCRPSQRD